MESLLVTLWPEEDEEKSCWDWYLSEVSQYLAVGQTDKRYDGVRQKINFSN